MKLTVLLAAALLAGATGAAKATTFTFLFDDSGGGPDGTIGTPIVGVGLFSTPKTLTPGLYALDSLPSYVMFYAFADGSYFTSADIATPTDGVAFDVTSFGAGLLRLEWTEVPGSPDADGGPNGGSLDLLQPLTSSDLTFEPTYFGGHNLYQMFSYGTYTRYFGNYLATATVPEPASWTMMLVGLGGLGATLRSRRRAPVARA
jgi:hypothetical protein